MTRHLRRRANLQDGRCGTEIFERWGDRRESPHTQRAYCRDVMAFCEFAGIAGPTTRPGPDSSLPETLAPETRVQWADSAGSPRHELRAGDHLEAFTMLLNRAVEVLALDEPAAQDPPAAR